MPRLFKRQVSLTLAKARSDHYFKYTDTTTITGLRVTFEAEKQLGKKPNTCRVEVYNLSEKSRGEVQKKPLHIRLSAGYQDQIERLFQGDLLWSDSKRDGADWVTTLQLADGERAFKHARIGKSYSRGVDARAALADVADAMGLKVKFSPSAQAQLRRQFVSGLCLDGPARSELSRLTAPFDLVWSIQDGELLFLKQEEYRLDQPIAVSQDAGMIGSPEFGAPEKKGGKPVLTVRTLLNAHISAGGRIRVTSRHVNGVFKVHRVQHAGDNFGDEWTTTTEAKSVL